MPRCIRLSDVPRVWTRGFPLGIHFQRSGSRLFALLHLLPIAFAFLSVLEVNLSASKTNYLTGIS
jgi:hypothetical protein